MGKNKEDDLIMNFSEEIYKRLLNKKNRLQCFLSPVTNKDELVSIRDMCSSKGDYIYQSLKHFVKYIKS